MAIEIEFWIDTHDYIKLMSVLGTILYSHSSNILKRCYYVSDCFGDDEEKFNTIDEAYEYFEEKYTNIPPKFKEEFEYTIQNIDVEE